jgi:tRNA dimethylallyltransferase
VRALLDLRLDATLPVMKALGVPELAAHLAGEITIEQAIIQAQQATRRYAKRQLTWLRTQTPRDFSDEDAAHNEICAQYSESLLGEIFPNIRDFVLTGHM